MRFGTIFFVFLAMTVVWLSLAESIESRHLEVDRQLRHDVSGLWGSSHLQNSAQLSGGRIESAEIQADLGLEYRKKGHYWYSTYKVDFKAVYKMPGTLPPDSILTFPLPVGGGLFNDFRIVVDGVETEKYAQEGTHIRLPLNAGTREVQVAYQGRGSDEWWYSFESVEGAPKNLEVVVNTDFDMVDFMDGSVSPDSREAIDTGWVMQWQFNNLLSGSKIGLEMPKKPNPGPALIDICRYGPLGLLLFFAALAVCSVADQRCPHPVHFVFLGAGFLSFHLLLVYLGDVMGLAASFALAGVISIVLNYHYVSRILGPEFARGRLLPAKILYLILFSSSFLFEGHRGLLLVFLMVFSLHLLMRTTAGVDWRLFDRKVNRDEPTL